jgi:hypothetical protein
MFENGGCVVRLCAWNAFGLILQGLRSTHGMSPDRSEFPRVHGARDKYKI